MSPADKEANVRLVEDGRLVALLAGRWVGLDRSSRAVVDLCASYQEVRQWPREHRKRVVPWCIPFAVHLWRVVRPETPWHGNTEELDGGGGLLKRFNVKHEQTGERETMVHALRPGDVLYSKERGHAAVYVDERWQVEGNNGGRCVLVPLEDWPSFWRPTARGGV